MAVHQLIYSSEASKKMLKSDLYIILRQARTNNKLSDVTGILAYLDSKFIQVLEGQKDIVANLFKKISQDGRHHDVKLICEQDVDSRAFTSWEMAYAAPSIKDLAVWAGLHNTTTLDETLENIKDNPGLVSEVLPKLLEHATDI